MFTKSKMFPRDKKNFLIKILPNFRANKCYKKTL